LENLSQILFNTSTFSKEAIAFKEGSDIVKSYTQLSENWQHLASFLENQFSTNQNRIGILVSFKSKSLYCIGGILLSKNVYVPLDCEAPLVRNLSIIQSSTLHALFMEKDTYELYEGELKLHQKKELENCFFIQFDEIKQVDNIPSNLAYILNTSGSTGIPKGVMISNKNAMTFINWASAEFEITSKNVVASIAPFHFDLSVFDLYVSIKKGASLRFFNSAEIKNPRLLAQRLATEKVSVIYTTPTILRLLLHHGKIERYDFSALRLVLFAGEIFPIEDLKQLKKVWTKADFYNLYGPTETNVCTYYKVPDNIEDQQTPFPIGKACIPNTTKVNRDGELLVNGVGVTPGYFNLPEKNQQVFEIDKQGKKWYHTGDLVREDENGDYVFIGRKDRMVKRRGLRIELDEIEHWVNQLDFIGQCAVVALENEKKEIIIKCFYTSDDKESGLNNKIRDYLLDKLPIYMLPDNFKYLEQLPQTSSHKIAYQVLVNR